MTPLEALRHHVTGAIERGEAQAITETTATKKRNYSVIVTRDLTESVVVEVEADDEASAQYAAIEKIENAENPPKWEIDDCSGGEAYTNGADLIEGEADEPLRTYTVPIAMDVRAYGYVEIEATCPDSAREMLTADYVAEHFTPHGAGNDDFDFTTPRDIYAELIQDNDTGDETIIDMDIENGRWVE